eukprot:505265-Karenia_brevis.AAC.1
MKRSDHRPQDRERHWNNIVGVVIRCQSLSLNGICLQMVHLRAMCGMERSDHRPQDREWNHNIIFK